MNPDSTNSQTIVTEQGTFRRLTGDERVGRGDWIMNEQNELTPWEGPTGFQASSFEHPAYRTVTEVPSSPESDPK